MATRKPVDELAALYAAGAPELTDAILRVARDMTAAKGATALAATEALRETIVHQMILADLLGRRRLLQEADALDPEKVAAGLKPTQWQYDTIPEVPFREAVADIVKREPRLAETAEQVAEVYQRGHGFAAAHSSSLTVTRKVQRVVAAMSQGGTIPQAKKVIAEIADWTRAYAETVYRTNLNTAYTAGRFEQMKDPAVARVMGAFKLTSIRDADVRRGRPEDHGENHLASDGLIAAPDDPVWEFARPPHGYNCRCAIRPVSRYELERLKLSDENGKVEAFHPRGMSWFFANFKPHPLFAKSGASYG